jgi:hypothetical protein
MAQQALRAFARAHLELEKEKQTTSNQVRPDVQNASALKKRILAELCSADRDVIRFEGDNAQRFLKLKYNRSSRVVSFKNVSDVVEGLSAADLRRVANLGHLQTVISDRIHQLRVVKTPSFEIIDKAPKRLAGGSVAAGSADLGRIVNQYETLTKRIKQTRDGLSEKRSELTQIINRSSQDVAEFMQSRAQPDTSAGLLQAGEDVSPSPEVQRNAPAPVRIDISQRGTYFVRQKTCRAPSRPETVKRIVATTEKTFVDLNADRQNFREWFANHRGQIARKLFDNLVEERKNTGTGEVRFALDKTTRNRL